MASQLLDSRVLSNTYSCMYLSHSNTHTHTHTYIHACTHHIHMIHTYTHTHLLTPAHKHTHTHTHTHTCTHTHKSHPIPPIHTHPTFVCSRVSPMEATRPLSVEAKGSDITALASSPPTPARRGGVIISGDLRMTSGLDTCPTQTKKTINYYQKEKKSQFWNTLKKSSESGFKVFRWGGGGWEWGGGGEMIRG